MRDRRGPPAGNGPRGRAPAGPMRFSWIKQKIVRRNGAAGRKTGNFVSAVRACAPGPIERKDACS